MYIRNRNREKQTEFINIWSKKIRAINLLGGKCQKCSDDNIFHLCFHHKDDNKEFEIVNIRNYRWSKIKEEVEKCELLCENCHQEFHYHKNESSDQRRKSKLVYLEYKGDKCEECGYNKCEASLSFHHRNEEDKLFWIGSLNERINSIVELKEHIIDELDKCDVICFNCHREKHIKKELFKKYKKEIYYKVDNFKEISKKVDRKLVIKMHNDGLTNILISERLGCARSTISDILRGRSKNDKKLMEG